MIAHEPFGTMLAWPRELTADEKTRLDRHLETCAECRQAAHVIEENRRQLRALAPFIPPEALREAVMTTTDEAHEFLSLILPLLAPFVALPSVLLVGLASVLFGEPGFVGALGFVLLYAAFAVYHVSKREAVIELPRNGDGEGRMWALSRMLLIDAGAILLGALLLFLIVAFLAHIAGTPQRLH